MKSPNAQKLDAALNLAVERQIKADEELQNLLVHFKSFIPTAKNWRRYMRDCRDSGKLNAGRAKELIKSAVHILRAAKSLSII